jgi:hypothetical protein
VEEEWWREGVWRRRWWEGKGGGGGWEEEGKGERGRREVREGRWGGGAGKGEGSVEMEVECVQEGGGGEVEGAEVVVVVPRWWMGGQPLQKLKFKNFGQSGFFANKMDGRFWVQTPCLPFGFLGNF